MFHLLYRSKKVSMSSIYASRLNQFHDLNKVIHNTIQPSRDGNSASGLSIDNSEATTLVGVDPAELAQTGAGPLNWAINHLPFEMHLRDSERKMKYNYCG